MAGRGGATDWELLQIKQNPQFWGSLQFWKSGQQAPNPFKCDATMTTQSFPNRTFQLWEYRVSHGSLLIRSPGNPDAKTNVDFVCIGVEYLAVPRFLHGVDVTKPTLEEMHQLEQTLGKQLTASSVVILASSG